MLNKIAVKLTDLLFKSREISEEEKEIYVYGWEVIISQASSFLTIFLIGVFSGRFLEMVLFIAVFLTLRPYSGGYHADTFLGCYIRTVGMYVVSYAIVLLLPTELTRVVIILLSCFAGIVVFLRAPQPHHNQPIDDEDKVIFKKKTRLIFLIHVVVMLAVLLFFPQYSGLILWMALSMGVVGILLLVPSKVLVELD